MASSCCDNNKKSPEMKSSYFIGRHDEREKLKTFLCESDLPLIQIYGLPYVGKTQLVKTVSIFFIPHYLLIHTLIDLVRQYLLLE